MMPAAAQTDPHLGQPVLTAGAPLQEARAAIVLIHGRGASAEDILSLVPELDVPGFAYLAPQAAGHTWYPYSFLMPVAQNEPALSSALRVIQDLIRQIEAAGIPPERIILLGFSQGACLATEFAARHARRYGGVVAFSGGLIGAPGSPRSTNGALAGTPVFLGCSDIDPHIPLARVQETHTVLSGLGADVQERIYPNMGHTINTDEIEAAREMMAELV